MSENNRVDPTVTSLFLVGFVTLLVGISGLLAYNAHSSVEAGVTFGTALGGAAHVISGLAIVMLVLAYMAARCGNAFAVALFSYIAISFYLTAWSGASGDGAQILFAIVGVFYAVFALVALLIKAPKLLVVLLVLVAIMYIFFGLFAQASAGTDTFKNMGLLYGVFALLSSIVATYMAIGLATEKLPVP